MKIFNYNSSIINFQRGFTLLEILVVVSIIILLAAIGVPTFLTLQPDLQLSGITRELITDLRYAQQLAVTEQVDHGIHLFPSENKYQLIRYGATEEILKEKSLPGGVNFQQIVGFTNNTAKFNPYGAARESGTITLINVNNKTKIIEVRPSGFVKISD